MTLPHSLTTSVSVRAPVWPCMGAPLPPVPAAAAAAACTHSLTRIAARMRTRISPRSPLTRDAAAHRTPASRSGPAAAALALAPSAGSAPPQTLRAPPPGHAYAGATATATVTTAAAAAARCGFSACTSISELQNLRIRICGTSAAWYLAGSLSGPTPCTRGRVKAELFTVRPPGRC
ncbi:hypothetical protein ONZ51_g8596 [Trametes cubensis]|uniref:Uncharacterized protein n=1 Tax=Trametes cubensis TaxID=1111947 RepID=A0AAD7X6F0_9APHY|nr:hypothetical protein ONZ51_g8596 [Trametes cubensis]